MSSTSNWVKTGGLFTFSLIFIFVLLKDRDIVTALTDASIACVIVALALKILDKYISNLQSEAIRRRIIEQKKSENNQESGNDKRGILSSLIDKSQ
ncbi:MAG: hypothetical protein PHF70_13290 [Opitutales bacterium]|nr:hypothetical protein [Opitutales bacterium]